MSREITCPTCGVLFRAKVPHHRYCSPECRRRGNYQPCPTGLPTATVGTISELRVAADLLSRGYSVFRSLSASCSCDLAILRARKLLKVEVTTGYVHGDGRIMHCKNGKNDWRPKADVLAVVTTKGIHYQNLPPQ